MVRKTSASLSNSSAVLRPSSVVRSRTMLRLPRLSISNGGLTPSSMPSIRPNIRAGSPVGGSILMMSAPQSARIPPAAGAATHTPSSTTLMPSIGPAIVIPSHRCFTIYDSFVNMARLQAYPRRSRWPSYRIGSLRSSAWQHTRAAACNASQPTGSSAECGRSRGPSPTSTPPIRVRGTADHRRHGRHAGGGHRIRGRAVGRRRIPRPRHGLAP